MSSRAQNKTYGYTLYVEASSAEEADAIVSNVLDGKVVGGETYVSAFRSEPKTLFAKRAGEAPY